MFSRSSFSPVSFSSVSFNGALKEQDGRSGYWRLFFTQLQEQSERVKNNTKSTTGKTLSDYGITVVKQPERAPKVLRAATKIVDRAPKVERKYTPAKEHARFDSSSYLATSWLITLEVRKMLGEFQDQALKFQKESEAQEDEDLLLLFS